MGSVRGNETNLSLRRKRGGGRDLSTRHFMENIDKILYSLSKSKFRSSFHLKEKDKN